MRIVHRLLDTGQGQQFVLGYSLSHGQYLHRVTHVEHYSHVTKQFTFMFNKGRAASVSSRHKPHQKRISTLSVRHKNICGNNFLKMRRRRLQGEVYNIFHVILFTSETLKCSGELDFYFQGLSTPKQLPIPSTADKRGQ